MYLYTVIWVITACLSFNWEDEVKKVITDDELQILFLLESNNELSAVGDGIRAVGVLQIHKACIIDVNRYFNLDYTHTDMYGRIDAVDVFYKYLAIGARLYYKKYYKLPTLKTYLRMWNGGIYAGYKKKSTLPYYYKFLKYQSKYRSQSVVRSSTND